ncbi:MAG: L,D-transpeptidase [Anaerolineales bacterium]|jgi:lipoprotein-anchoring transpeptidase ErfK/SrfK|nr:L,D-transpeptidase [Anaerolineales bacterium]
MNTPSVSAKRDIPHPGLIFLFLTLLALVGAASWLAFTSPAFAADAAPQPTPTYSISFALAQIAKPTYTPIPTATLPPTEIPTEVVIVAGAEIVSEALTYDYVESMTQNDPPPPLVYSGGKSILVDISEQHMYVYDGSLLVYSFVASTGMNNATRAGNFSVLNKIPNAYGATWNIWMPSWLGIYWAGSLQNGIHALPILSNGATLWGGYLGTPISYGCVVLGSYEAQALFDWADIGTPVDIQW